MTQPFPQNPPDEYEHEPRSHEWIVAVALGYVALAVLPLILCMIVIAAKFQGLTDFTALDHAQLARHVQVGDGWVTSLLRPLSLSFKPNLQHHPDLYNAPLHPWLLALVFGAFGATDSAVAWTGAVLWVVSLWLTFAVARAWMGPRRAWFPVVLYAMHTPALITAVNGLHYVLGANLVLLAVWSALSPPTFEPALDGEVAEQDGFDEGPGAHEPAPERVPVLPAWRIWLTGVWCGLAALNHFLFFPFAIVMGIFLARREPERGAAAAAYLGGFLGMVIPWTIVLFTQTGSPVATIFWYDLLVNSGSFPGDMIWRITEAPGHPLVFLAVHPLQTLLKLLSGLGRYWREAPIALGPLAAAFFAWTLFQGVGGRTWNRGLIALVVGIIAVAGVGSLFRPDPAVLLAFTPVLAVAGSYGLSVWLAERVRPIWRRDREIPERVLHGFVLAGFAAASAVPLLSYILTERPAQSAGFAEQFRPIRSRVPEDGAVLTDQPALVAWFANRRAVYLPQTEEGMGAIEKTAGKVSASYVTPAVYQLPQIEQSTWWYWLVLPDGVYRGLEPSEPRLANAVFRVRKQVIE